MLFGIFLSFLALIALLIYQVNRNLDKKRIPELDNKIKYLESKFDYLNHLGNIDSKNKSSDPYINKIFNTLEEKEIFKGEIVDLNYKLPEDSYPGTASEPWKVYCVIQFKVGTWTEDSWIKHFDKEDVLIYSIDDDKLEKLDDYKKTITKP